MSVILSIIVLAIALYVVVRLSGYAGRFVMRYGHVAMWLALLAGLAMAVNVGLAVVLGHEPTETIFFILWSPALIVAVVMQWRKANH